MLKQNYLNSSNNKLNNLDSSYNRNRRMCLGNLPPNSEMDPLSSDYLVRRNGTDIYFYDGVTVETAYLLKANLKSALVELATTSQIQKNKDNEEGITIYINSPGGDLISAFALYDFIKTIDAPITTVIDGLCASAATLIFLAGEERIMSPNSLFLMHELSYGAEGKNSFMNEMAENANKNMKHLVKIYYDETELFKNEIDPKTKKVVELPEDRRNQLIETFLKHDFELTYEECIEKGIISENDNVHLSAEEFEFFQKTINEYSQKLLISIVEQHKKNEQKPVKKPTTKKTSTKKKTTTTKKEKSTEKENK